MALMMRKPKLETGKVLNHDFIALVASFLAGASRNWLKVMIGGF